MEELLRDAAFSTPDPERALKNIATFCDNNPDYIERLRANIIPISLLFSYSQFLSVFCISSPEMLFEALKYIGNPPDKDTLSSSLRESLINATDRMKAVRSFKKKELLKITLRDILKKIDITETMLELSVLADVIVNESVTVLRNMLNETYGEPEEDAFAVISLGKLGSEELNFSSDIDLIFVYEKETGETSGLKTPQGLNVNRISNHEYYCKLGENLNRLLSINTADGFAYRVDLRLRPEGQRGSLALSLASYETYYESWGTEWERAMLLRARPIAGDRALGDEFLEMIKPFVYRKYVDFSALAEIRHIKTRMDSAFKKNDIKKGYGGIREIEFFVHVLQLIYAGREPLLRERSTLKALHRLLQKSLIGDDDYLMLSDNYIFLRTLEHRLQQLNDLQTHSLPSGENEQKALSKKMGFSEKSLFLSELEIRRTKVRYVYNSLFKEEEKREQPEGSRFAGDSGMLFDEELSDAELKEYLANTGLKDLDKGVRNIQHIKDATYNFQTLRGRRIMSEILPFFVDAALKSASPDMALNHLQSFATMLSSRESYLAIFKENKDLIPILIDLFSQNEYLSKTIIRRPDYLELIGQEIALKKSRRSLKNELEANIKNGQAVSDAIRIMRQIEELRLSLLFFQKKINVIDVIKGLSKTAEAILSLGLANSFSQILLNGFGGGLPENLAIVGLGKLGGREITFNSDIDIVFVSGDNVTEEQTKAAERLLRLLISYTREGIAYSVDMRLRPDGAKGPLVSSISSFKEYYSKNAAFWELQALLKARPVGGDIKTGESFINMAREILVEQGRKISASDIRAMRCRIQKELAKETDGRDRFASYDIKLGSGGLEELEFTVQYLQLINCSRYPSLLVQGTLDALKQIKYAGIIKDAEIRLMHNAYIFYRTLESYLRLRERDILRKDDEGLLNAVSQFLGIENKEQLIMYLEETRSKIRDIYDRLVS